MCETGGGRRAWLRGLVKVTKRYLVQVAARNLGDHSSATTGTAGVQWEPDGDTMAYARYSRGYKAFGF